MSPPCQGEKPGQVGDHFRHLPDHLVEVAVLAALIVDIKPDEAPPPGWPISDAGTSALAGAECSNALPTSQGRPAFFATPCKSRLVMSSAQP